MGTYKVVWVQELLWAVVVAAVVFASQVLMEFDATKVEDWRAYATAFVSGIVRVVAAQVFNFFTVRFLKSEQG